MTSTESVLTRRNATLDDMANLLRQQHADKLDVVVPASQIRAADGYLEIDGIGEPILTPEGVTTPSGRFLPSATCEAGLADKLRIPSQYLRRMREQHIDLYDRNINTWLADEPSKRFLVRNLRGHNDDPGIARAFLSSQYRFTDNLDVLLAVLAGVKDSGVQVKVTSCDLTERRMYAKVHSPEIAALAPTLLGDYRSPFTGQRGSDCPVVFAGFIISNSETGHGSFSLTPQLTVQVCNNGMTITKDALRDVHIGGKLEDGRVRWSDATQEAALTLITKKARDAVSTFLNEDYVERKISEMERESGVNVDDPKATLEHVSQKLRFTEEQQNTIFNHFIDGGDRTSGGVMHAVTSAAQTLSDADDAYDMERQGWRAMSLAAAFQR